MYKVLLVDDEILIREKMAKKISWNDLGFELVAACENGQEAIEVLERECIDVVLTDICMPYINGLELSRHIYEHDKSIKVVILSGYAEFEYAKQAMKYQVYSYLLKPITSEELSQVLLELCSMLDREHKERDFQNVYEDTYSLFRIQNLLQIAQGTLSSDLIHARLKEYKPEFYRESVRYCAGFLYIWEHPEAYRIERIEQELNYFSPKILAFRNLDNGIIIFAREESNVNMQSLWRRLADYICSYIWEQYRVLAGILVGIPVTDCANLHFSYEKIRELKDFLYLEREDSLYFWDEYYKVKREIHLWAYDNEYEKKVLIAVQSNLTEEISRLVSETVIDARKNWYRKPRVISIFQSVLICVVNAFQRMGIEDNLVFEKAQMVLEGLYQYGSITEMAKQVKEFLFYAAEVRNANRESYGERQAVLSLEYIEQHFADCDFSMAAMCEKLAISVSYFSAAFKDYTGKTFIEVLTDRRIQEAKLLLQNSSLKTYEVAERCGYRDSSYFSTLFKKCCGMTPKEYAKANRK